ncbi:hypothetical protein BD769DRAFT_1386176 [Suillus cothurnatus]|nr:hypothetical protein BD769DRAFT_1386176 [Suillus cothurnatus]
MYKQVLSESFVDLCSRLRETTGEREVREREALRANQMRLLIRFFVWEGLLLPDQRQGAGVWADHVIREKPKQRHSEMKSFGDQEKTTACYPKIPTSETWRKFWGVPKVSATSPPPSISRPGLSDEKGNSNLVFVCTSSALLVSNTIDTTALSYTSRVIKLHVGRNGYARRQPGPNKLVFEDDLDQGFKSSQPAVEFECPPSPTLEENEYFDREADTDINMDMDVDPIDRDFYVDDDHYEWVSASEYIEEGDEQDDERVWDPEGDPEYLSNDAILEDGPAREDQSELRHIVAPHKGQHSKVSPRYNIQTNTTYSYNNEHRLQSMSCLAQKCLHKGNQSSSDCSAVYLKLPLLLTSTRDDICILATLTCTLQLQTTPTPKPNPDQSSNSAISMLHPCVKVALCVFTWASKNVADDSGSRYCCPSTLSKVALMSSSITRTQRVSSWGYGYGLVSAHSHEVDVAQSRIGHGFSRCQRERETLTAT